MLVYRITLGKFSSSLKASGNPARWNSKDVKIIYTAASRALACLENVVHRTSVGLAGQFRTMTIEIPDEIAITSLKRDQLQERWQEFERYPYTQALGDAWIAEARTAVLQVPSAIIPQEYNYLLNPAHKDFRKIRLVNVEPFEFDGRIKM